MPRQKRWALKRALDRAVEDIERAEGHVADVYLAFQEPHPDRAAQLEMIGKALAQTAKSIAYFCDEVI
jgi:hypothetical protein